MAPGWALGGPRHAGRVGAVAEKDPGQPWTEAEVRQRVWALEGAAGRQTAVNVLYGAAIAVTAAIAVAGALLASRR